MPVLPCLLCCSPCLHFPYSARCRLCWKALLSRHILTRRLPCSLSFLCCCSISRRFGRILSIAAPARSWEKKYGRFTTSLPLLTTKNPNNHEDPPCFLQAGSFFEGVFPMFFTYLTDLPTDAGFSLYASPHICMLILILLCCLFGCHWFHRQSPAQQERFTHQLGLVILLTELLRIAVYAAVSALNLYELPLHLCGLAVYLCAFHSLWKPDWLSQVLYTLCLPGAWCALLFPDWTCYPFFSFFSLHSFFAHGLLVFYIHLQTASGSIRPRLSAIWKPILFLCFVIPPIYWFDLHFHANYMFLQLSSEGSPLLLLSQLAGGNTAGYLILFSIVVFGMMLSMDLLYLRFSAHKK